MDQPHGQLCYNNINYAINNNINNNNNNNQLCYNNNNNNNNITNILSLY